MVKKIEAWECEICGTTFIGDDGKQNALDCSEYHSKLENLKVVDIKWECDSEEKFPQTIIIEDEEFSGKLAAYELVKVASMEDFDEEN